MRLHGLPDRILVIPSPNIFIQTAAAIHHIAAGKARQVFDNKGAFIGVELGHFGPAQTCGHAEVLPPAELPGVYFQAPRADNTHKMVMDMVYSGHGAAEFA